MSSRGYEQDFTELFIFNIDTGTTLQFISDPASYPARI
jgi:hypothetical protein